MEMVIAHKKEGRTIYADRGKYYGARGVAVLVLSPLVTMMTCMLSADSCSAFSPDKPSTDLPLPLAIMIILQLSLLSVYRSLAKGEQQQRQNGE